MAVSRFDQLKRVPSFSGQRNILAYRSFDDLDNLVGNSVGIVSNTAKEVEVSRLFKEIQKKYPLQTADGRPAVKSGYYPWLWALVKANNIRLPEDSEAVMTAIDQFETAKRSSDFKHSKVIASYPTLDALYRACLTDSDTEDSGDLRELTGPGIQLISQAGLSGHVYELYAITTPEAASLNLAKELFDGHQGWCVKDPRYFKSYAMGPDNPAYLFRKQGRPYALADFRSGDIRDVDDRKASVHQVVELLHLEMPEDLKKVLIRSTDWTKKYSAQILAGGPDAAIVAAFKMASFPGIQADKAADALTYWQMGESSDDWVDLPTEAVDIVKTVPILAACYAIKVLKHRWLDKEDLIFSQPWSTLTYYDGLCDLGQLPGNEFPEVLTMAIEQAKCGKTMLIVNYLYKTKRNVPGALELIKKVSPLAYSSVLKVIKT